MTDDVYTRYLVRVIVGGSELTLLEFESRHVDAADVVRDVSRMVPAASVPPFDVTFELRREGERWSGKRYRVRPLLEVTGPC